MSRARVLTFVFLGLFPITMAAALVYGAATTGDAAIAGGWVFLAAAYFFLVAALIAHLVWRRTR